MTKRLYQCYVIHHSGDTTCLPGIYATIEEAWAAFEKADLPPTACDTKVKDTHGVIEDTSRNIIQERDFRHEWTPYRPDLSSGDEFPF